MTDPALEQLAQVLRKETGIVIQGPQLASLEAAMARVRPSMDARSFLRAIGVGAASDGLLERLIDEVTVNETFFFRQRDELDAIQWHPLLEAAREAGSSTVRVWVAACSTGEEAYTLAMLACEALGTSQPPVSILATDISTDALARARAGGYRGRTVRMLEPRIRERYFVPDGDGDGVAVGESLRRMVEFGRHNLVNDPVPGSADGRFDLVACRNVLIYFDGQTVERAIGTLERALTPCGVLVLGAADRLCDSAQRLGRPGRPPRSEAAPPKRELRRPLGREEPAPVPPSELASALAAANEGSLRDAVEITERLLEANPLDADAYFVRGLAELGLGDADAAVRSLRRALYVDPSFALAAFKLARAHELRGDRDAAVRAYELALHTLDPEDSRHDAILDQVDLADVAVACSLSMTRLREAVA
jgi:chemotaxis protein methyltransferase CheR